MDLTAYDISVTEIIRNGSRAKLYEHGLEFDAAQITASGAIATLSGAKTGRSPKDKRIVEGPDTKDDIWWGPVNMPLSAESFQVNHQRAIDFLNTKPRLYVMDGFAGW
ncbi:MAG: phosphoenolpyruvate carboxykinase (ATP), partial [Pirellulaceae bacterium]|nr:phosphoenolpyruvate carboxykinase (ATP) [Pirellulaceae bacterium]